MKTIYKYTIPVRDACEVSMPEFAKLLHLDYQGDPSNLCVWAEVDPTLATVKRFFYVRGTGHPLGDQIEKDGRYVGTVLVKEMGLVWHVYEVSP